MGMARITVKMSSTVAWKFMMAATAGGGDTRACGRRRPRTGARRSDCELVSGASCVDDAIARSSTLCAPSSPLRGAMSGGWVRRRLRWRLRRQRRGAGQGWQTRRRRPRVKRERGRGEGEGRGVGGGGRGGEGMCLMRYVRSVRLVSIRCDGVWRPRLPPPVPLTVSVTAAAAARLPAPHSPMATTSPPRATRISNMQHDHASRHTV